MGLVKKSSAGSSSGKKPNPFDLKVNHVKFDVLNRDRTGTRGAPSQAKQRNHQIRAATILPEILRRGKQSSFQDRRFGERDKHLTNEEKMLERFAKEKQRKASASKKPLKAKKRNIFNLDPDEGEEDSIAELTHLGHDVDKLSDFSGPEDDFDDGDGEMLDRDSVRHLHFGGQEEEDEESAEPKTRAEIMQEIIAKSKFYRAERQKIREENAEMCEELNESFQEVRGTLLDEANRYDRSKEPKGNEDEYDLLMRQMAFDRRSKPSDRKLSPEEEAQRLEALLEAKEARMQGHRASKEDESDNEEAIDTKFKGATPVDKEEERALLVLAEFCGAESKKALAGPYKHLVELSKGPASVALGRAIRTRLGQILEASFPSSAKSRPFLPSREILMLFHLIGRIYSTSDYHHVICTPASLLMAAFLEHGRMTRPKHLLSGLFLAQTLLTYHAESKRLVPEVFTFVNLVLKYVQEGEDGPGNLFFDGTFNRLIQQRMKANRAAAAVEPRPLGFEDLLWIVTLGNDYPLDFNQRILSASLAIVKKAAEIYAGIPSFPEYFEPLLSIISKRLLDADGNPVDVSLARYLASLVGAAHKQRRPLVLQHFKPVALPMLNPDLEEGKSKDRDAQETARMRAAYMREFKGAKRELRRDNQFIARHEAAERKRKDTEYKDMINRIYGTIANDNANLQPSAKKRKK